MSVPQEKAVLDALRTIIDPDFRKDIVSLGFVKNLTLGEGSASFDIELTTSACPVKETFRSDAEKAVRALGVPNVSVKMTAQAPKSRPKQPGLAGVKQIIAVASCKGGVGKSTVAATLACELARRGHATGLLDADVYGPSLPTMFGVHRPELHMGEDNLLFPVEIDRNLHVMSFGFLLGDAPAILRGPIVSGYVQQLLHQVDWGELDFLVIDMPPGTGDIQLTITQQVQLTGAVIVTTRQSLSLVDVAKGILMFEKTAVPMLGVIENMAYFECGKCGEKHHPFGEPGSELVERFGLETLAEFPIRPHFARNYSAPFEEKGITEAVDRIVMALGRKSAEPKAVPAIDFTTSEIRFTWSDGSKATVSNRALRESCGCALCIDEHTGEKILKPEQVPSDIKAEAITPLGNYAVSITWSDGHSSGIHPYKKIRELAG